MSANAGTIAGRRPFQVPAGIVIVALALVVGTLAVVVATQPETVAPSTPVEQSNPLFRDDAAEMAALKTAIGREWVAERFGTGSSDAAAPNEANDLAAIKSGLALRGTDAVKGSSGSAPSEASELAALKSALAERRTG